MRKLISEFSLRAAAVIVLSGGIIAFMLAAAGRAPAADLSQGVVQEDRSAGTLVCGQQVDQIVLFDELERPTVPGRTPMFYCITGTTLVPSDIPPPPEYCCH